MRVHANFAEYVPFTLVLMALAESMAPPRSCCCMRRLVLVAGRLIHAYGVSQSPPIMRYRVYGMWLTFAALGDRGAACAYRFRRFSSLSDGAGIAGVARAQTAAAARWCT